jgi:hypothetical protein
MLSQTMRARLPRPMIVVLLAVCWPASLLAAPPAKGAAQAPQSAAVTVEAKTAGLQHMPGFLPLHWDAKAGKLYLEIPRLNIDMVYFDSLPYGTGSNDLGLDRGQVSEARLVRFERFGPKIFLVRPNENFRSSAQDPAERLAVRQSFPESILGSFSIEAENPPGSSEAGAVLVDAT